MNLRPYCIVPKLIPQPTWGGHYIAAYKNISDQRLRETVIGQSYELCEETMLTTVTDPTAIPIEIADPKTGKTLEVIGDPSTIFPLQALIDQDPIGVLGKEYVDKYGPKMQILIKFTQAKGNSFQVHVRPGQKLGHWKPKPESWYFMEAGKATLGLKQGIDLSEYKKVCLAIEAFMKAESERVRTGGMSVRQAKKDIEDFLLTHSPFRYVNVVDLAKGSVVDLSSGGIHHSWEEGDDIPDGNIVYEVQCNVMDADCTLRSFDKGKFGEDGSIRPVHVEDYFAALDTDPEHNDPSTLITAESGSILFDTPFYSTRMNSLAHSIDTTYGSHSFVHRFFYDGEHRGISKFIPHRSET